MASPGLGRMSGGGVPGRAAGSPRGFPRSRRGVRSVAGCQGVLGRPATHGEERDNGHEQGETGGFGDRGYRRTSYYYSGVDSCVI